MRQRIFNIIVIIAMVASMCITTAVPAVAIDTSVKSLQVVVTPNEANRPATIDVSFTTTNSLSTGLIYIELPDECHMPASIAPGNIKVNGNFCSSVTITDHTLNIDPAVYIGANTAVTVNILEAAGILTPYLSQERNNVYPNASNLHPAIYLLDSFAHLRGDTAQVPDALYKIKVWTSADTLYAFGSNFQIFDWIEIDKYDFGKGDIVNVTGAGFTPGDTFTLNVDTNQPLIGNCTVQPDGTVNIAAQVAQKIPLIPLNGTDESGRASNILWPKCSMMTDAVYLVSFSSVYPLAGNPTMTTWIQPEGVWHLIPSVDIPAPVLPGSVMKIFGFDWGEVSDINISGPVTDPVTMPNLEELDTDCYCMPASFIMPGEFVPMADLQLYIGGDITQPGTVLWTCDDLDEPVDGPGCADDFLVERPVPRTITPGIYQVTVDGVDQMNEQHVVVAGEVMTDPLPPQNWYTSMNYVRCFLEVLFGSPEDAQYIISLMNESCCDIEYGSSHPCGSPCELDPHACVDCEVTVIAEFEVPAPSLVVNPATICKGGTVSLAGAGFVPGEDFGRAVIASGIPQEIASGITVDGQGNFLNQNVMIPPGIDPGTHTITVTFDLEGQEILASATVGIVDCGGPTTCSLTTSSTEGGSVVTPGEDTYLYSCGTVVAIVAEASPNYEFTGWTGDTATIANAISPNTTITVDDNYSIIAEFELSGPATCSLTVTSGTCGQIAAPGVGTFDYPCGTSVPIEVEYAQACNCCEFTGWEGDIATVNAPGNMSTSILVNGNYTIEAVFDFEWCEWAYDDNANCEIDYPEMIDALMDYLTDKITFGQMIDVLMAYLTS